MRPSLSSCLCMRLTAGGVRELHWHKEAEWSFMIAGNARITAADNDGHNFVADVTAGDLWYFPEVFAHTPKKTLAKNFAVNETAFDPSRRNNVLPFRPTRPLGCKATLSPIRKATYRKTCDSAACNNPQSACRACRVRIADTRNPHLYGNYSGSGRGGPGAHAGNPLASQR
jgi:hypothetical protein